MKDMKDMNLHKLISLLESPFLALKSIFNFHDLTIQSIIKKIHLFYPKCLVETVGTMNILNEVVTISEAAQMWNVRTDTVRRLLGARKKPLLGRKSGVIWLISVDSLKRRWGDPIYPMLMG